MFFFVIYDRLNYIILYLISEKCFWISSNKNSMTIITLKDLENNTSIDRFIFTWVRLEWGASDTEPRWLPRGRASPVRCTWVRSRYFLIFSRDLFCHRLKRACVGSTELGPCSTGSFFFLTFYFKFFKGLITDATYCYHVNINYYC